ncbi:MAG TPA: ATP-binding protein [Anaerolineaceae bacterium]|nr:ATP-binding protein [Anaerolineaceae bacterium]
MFLTTSTLTNSLNQLPAAEMQWVIWMLPALLTIGTGLAIWKLQKWDFRYSFCELKWFVFLALLVFPLSFLNFKPFDGQLLTLSGETAQPIVMVLSALPVFLAVGLVGPLPAVILGLGTGLVQYLRLGQDPIGMFFYAGLAIAFAWILAHEKSQWHSDWKQHTVARVLWSFLLSVAFIILTQFTHSLVYGERSLLVILEQILILVVSHIPEVLISSLIVWAFVYWLNSDWHPKDFIKARPSSNPYDKVMERIQELANGDYEEQIAPAVLSGNEKALFTALEKLRANLQTRNDAQARLLSVDPSHYSREGYDLVLSSILRAALTRDASSARLILLDKSPESRRGEMRLRLGQGENTRLYAYLDTLIIEKIGDQDQLILSDLKVDQYFGLTSGTPHPQSIAALQLRGGGNSQGVLWVGFEQNHWFDQEDIQFYQQLAYRASAALSTKEQISKVQNEKGWLNLAFDAFSDPILIINKDGQIQFSNSAANAASDKGEALFGKKGSEVRIVNEKLNSLLCKDKKSGDLKTLQLDGNKTYEVLRIPFQRDQEKQGEVVLLRDTSWLQQLNNQKNEFVSNISHDLRAPLWLMKGHTKLLSNIGKLSLEQRKYVDKIDAGIDTMTRLVDKVLNLERLDGDGLLVYNTFSIQETIDDTIKLLGVQAQQKKISLNVDYGGLKSPNISADQVMVQQALYNLIENAIKFSPRGESVLISAERDASWMHISVKDNGKGIAPLDQPKLFTRFFHVDDDLTYENRGQGLGLAIVKSVADKHGGNVSVKSILGEGSTFYLDLPLHKI